MGLGKSPEGFRLLGSEVGLQKDITVLPILSGHLHRLHEFRLIGSRPRVSSCSSGHTQSRSALAMTFNSILSMLHL